MQRCQPPLCAWRGRVQWATHTHPRRSVLLRHSRSYTYYVPRLHSFRLPPRPPTGEEGLPCPRIHVLHTCRTTFLHAAKDSPVPRLALPSSFAVWLSAHQRGAGVGGAAVGVCQGCGDRHLRRSVLNPSPRCGHHILRYAHKPGHGHARKSASCSFLRFGCIIVEHTAYYGPPAVDVSCCLHSTPPSTPAAACFLLLPLEAWYSYHVVQPPCMLVRSGAGCGGMRVRDHEQASLIAKL